MIGLAFLLFMSVVLIGLRPPGVEAQVQKPNNIASTPVSGSKAEDAVHIQLQKPAMVGELTLTVNRAIELALERNPALIVERIHLEQARDKIQEEKGFYDPLFNVQASLSRKDNVVASRFYPSGLYVEQQRAHGFSLEAKTYTGGRFTLGLDYSRLDSTSNTQTLSPQYSANFTFNFTHALLRDFGWDVNMARIRVAEKGETIAAHTLAQKISQLIQQVEEAYYGVIFLRQDLEWKKKSLEFAHGLLKKNEDLLRGGLVAPVSVVEARAGVAVHEEGVITAESEAKKFEDRLKLLLQIDFGNATLSLMDPLKGEAVGLDIERSLQLALKQRPEIMALQTELEQREIERKFASNQTLPRLDLTAQYGMSGLSGKPNPTCVDPNAFICAPVGDFVRDSIFEGQTRPKDAFDRFFTRHPFDNWSVGLKLQIPLGNRTAEAQLSQANLRFAESRTRLRAVRDQIEAEIRDAIRETVTAYKRIAAAHETVKFTEEQLDATRRKFDAGLTTSYDVLQVLDDLDKARSNETKALMDYNVGQGKVRLAEGSALEAYNIELKKPPRYRFE
jgi:outer membrane protein